MNWAQAFDLCYEPQTTFWSDFSIADKFGISAIKDTYERAINEWKTDKVYATELVMVLNYKCWYYYSKGQNKISELYSDLYYKAYDTVANTLKDEDLKYFFNTID